MPIAIAIATAVIRCLSPYGAVAVPSKPVDLELELYAFESCPDCRLVRELLCSLQLPYTLFTAGQGSPARPKIVQRLRRLILPILVDPNINTEELAKKEGAGAAGSDGYHEEEEGGEARRNLIFARKTRRAQTIDVVNSDAGSLSQHKVEVVGCSPIMEYLKKHYMR